jgi:hypothetical protein
MNRLQIAVGKVSGQLANAPLIVQGLLGQFFSVAFHLQAYDVLATHLDHLLRLGYFLFAIDDKQRHREQYETKVIGGFGKFAIGRLFVGSLQALY